MNEEETFLGGIFSEVGDKIKGFSKFLFIICTIASIIMAIVIFINSSDNSYNDDESITNAVAWCYLLIGPIASYLSSLLLYGFGELINRICNIEEHLCFGGKELTTITDKNNIADKSEKKFKCTRCQNMVLYGQERCENCGQKFDWKNYN